MNKPAACLLVLAYFFTLSHNVRANDLVAFPTGDAQWTLTFGPSPSGGSASPAGGKKPTSVEVTQLNKVRRIVITWSDGSTTQEWAIPPMPVVFEEDPRTGSIDPNLSNSLNERFSKSHIPYDSNSFSWVTPQNLKEKDPINYNGQECFHYIGQVQPAPTASVEKREAWIDAKTLQPVAVDLDNESLASFTFSPKPPAGPLNLPPKFKREIDYYKLLTGYK